MLEKQRRRAAEEPENRRLLGMFSAIENTLEQLCFVKGKIF